MRLPQLSIAIENTPGSMVAPCKVLADAGINIVTLSLVDAQRAGVLRLIVADWQRARDLLEAAGFAVGVTDVLAIEVTDQPGGLLELLGLFAQARLDVAYMYAFTSRLGDRAVLVFHFNDIDAAITCLTRAGINPVAPVDLYEKD
jgi:hypothetical protein